MIRILKIIAVSVGILGTLNSCTVYKSILPPGTTKVDSASMARAKPRQNYRFVLINDSIVDMKVTEVGHGRIAGLTRNDDSRLVKHWVFENGRITPDSRWHGEREELSTINYDTVKDIQKKKFSPSRTAPLAITGVIIVSFVAWSFLAAPIFAP